MVQEKPEDSKAVTTLYSDMAARQRETQYRVDLGLSSEYSVGQWGGTAREQAGGLWTGNYEKETSREEDFDQANQTGFFVEGMPR